MSRPRMPLCEQGIGGSGAATGVGRATARRAAARGARVVLGDADAAALRAVDDAIRAEGGEAVREVADPTDPEALERLAARAAGTYGGIDTWVNASASSAPGPALPFDEGA